jgi:Mor family transcriptional regulator
MSYLNGKKVLPDEVLIVVQKYVEGELLYIPKKCSGRTAWGKKNGTRKEFDERNLEIYKLYKSGLQINDLMNKYRLTRSSISKVIKKVRSG